MTEINASLPKKRSIFLLSGNPGTGKTTVSNFLHLNYEYHVLHLGEIVLEQKLYEEVDTERDSKIVDADKLNNFVKNSVDSLQGFIICESHYADMIELPDIEIAFILRARPPTIIKRLIDRKYSDDKLRENAEAEFLGDCTSYMLEKERLFAKNRIFEIDTTQLTTQNVAELIHQIILNPNQYPEFLVGKISWLSDETLDLSSFIKL